MLSFLGFDGISTLAEESTGKKNPAGRAMVGALFIVAFLFIVQTWLASLLAGGREAFSDDEVGNAFFKLVEAASSTGWMNAFFVVNVLAVGFANAMAAQAATSRLLYSMSRDRQLPSFLSKVSARQVPMARDPRGQRDQRGAGAVLRRPDRADLVAGELRRARSPSACCTSRSSGTTSGARSRRTICCTWWCRRWASSIIGYVLFNADSLAKIGGIVWLGVGAVVFIVNKVRGRGVPELGDDRPISDDLRDISHPI